MRNKKKKNFDILYDEGADTLYVFTENSEFYADQKDDYIELKSSEDNKRVGYILLNYDKHRKDNTIAKMPWKGVDFVKDIIPAIKKYIDDYYD